MVKALVSGAHGFIGSHLCKALRDKGWSVTELSRELLYQPEKLTSFCEELLPDYIFHLAAYGNMANQKDAGEIIFSNIFSTFNLLNATKNISYQGFINFGTSSEYGAKHKPMVEEDMPEADTFYSASKVATTYVSKAFAKQYTRPIVTIRPFSVYGPGEAEFRFIPQIVKHLKLKSVMDLDMEGKHDWIYISDFINGVLKIADNARELGGQVVNVGTGIQSDNVHIVSLLEKISGLSLSINYFSNMRVNDSPIWVNGSKKLLLYGWKPQVSLQEGLRKCYEYFAK